MRLDRVAELSGEEAVATVNDYGVHQLPRCRILDPDMAHFLANSAGELDYSNVVEFSPAAAQCLVNALNGGGGREPAVRDGAPWILDGLRKVSEEVATVLGSYRRGALQLNGLTMLSREAAQRLSRLSNGPLCLDSLLDTSPDTLRDLLRTNRGVHLNAIRVLGPEYAEVLADVPNGWQACETPEWQLQLNGLCHLPDVTAEALVRCARGMRKVVYEEKYSPIVTLDALAVLDSPKLARAINRGERPVIKASLDQIQWISARAAAELAANHLVDLPQLRHLTSDIAQGLTQGDARVSLESISKLTRKIAIELGKKSGGELMLDGLVEISADIAEALAPATVSKLTLNGLKSLDLEAAKKLGTSRARRLELRGLDGIDDSIAAALSQLSGSLAVGRLSSGHNLPKVLRSPLARILSKHLGALDLRGVEEVTDDAAKDLSLHGGPHILLDDVKVMPAHVADKLVSYRGKLSLCGLKQLTDQAAAELVGYEGWALVLRGLESPTVTQLSILERNPRIKLPTP